MDINQLTETIKQKINKSLSCDKVEVEDKTFLHQSHKSHHNGKFHIILKIKSLNLKQKNKIDSSKEIYKILDQELKKYIHSIQILID